MQIKTEQCFKTIQDYLNFLEQEKESQEGLIILDYSFKKCVLKSVLEQFFHNTARFPSKNIYLNFSNSSLNAEDIEALADALKQGLGSYCTGLNLQANEITAAQAMQLWEALQYAPQKNTFLLDLSNNIIGNRGLIALGSQGKWVNHYDIRLQRNGFTNSGVNAFCQELLKLNISMLSCKVDLSYNEEINKNAVSKIIKTIKSKTFPLGVIISLKNDDIPDKCSQHIQNFCEKSQQIKTLLSCMQFFRGTQDGNSILHKVPKEVILHSIKMAEPSVSIKKYSFFNSESTLNKENDPQVIIKTGTAMLL